MRSISQQRGQQLVLLEAIPVATAERMRSRLRELGAALGKEHAQPGRHTAAIADMLGCWVSLERADKAALTKKFVNETADQPSWAVEKACQAIRRGEAEGVSLDYPPSTIRLRTVVQRFTAPVLDEAIGIRNLLEAEVEYQPTAAERERVKLGFQRLHETLQVRRVADDPPTPKSQAPSDDELRRLYPKRQPIVADPEAAE